jgi:Ala-tRNA(Pro) deacylase
MRTPDELCAMFDELGLQYERHHHAPVHTCDEAEAAIAASDAVQTKNLFLRDKRGRRHFLLVTTCAKAVDVKRFAETADADHLSFGSPDRLMRHLGVEPGSVTVFGVVNDESHGVELFVDRDVWGGSTARWRCHPLVNSQTVVMSRGDIERFLERTGHAPRVVSVETRPPEA